MRLFFGLAAAVVLSGQVNLSGVWRWDRPANDTNPNGASQMWKKIEQDGNRITVRTRTVSFGRCRIPGVRFHRRDCREC